MRRPGVLLGILGFVLVTAVWWLFIIGPRNSAIDTAEDRLFDAEQQQSLLRTRIAQLNAIADQELTYTVAIGDMETSIPTEPQFDAFLEDLTFLAERTGVDLIAITANPPAATTAEGVLDGLFEIDVNVSVEGQFFEILGLLYGLEDMERLVRVDTLSLNPIAIPEETTTTTTTTTLAPGATTSSTTSSTTTTTLLEERLRPEPGLLAVNLTATLFTRTPVAVPALEVPTTTEPPPEEEESQ